MTRSEVQVPHRPPVQRMLFCLGCYNSFMQQDLQKIIEQFVDFLLPSLTPYEAGLYVLLLRKSHLSGTQQIRIGKRTIAGNLGSSRGEKTNYAHITKLINGLEMKSCIRVGDTSREGTLYTVLLPEEIPLVRERMSISRLATSVEDYFTKPEKRTEIFERDGYICYYCGEKVTTENGTLDHLIPQFKGGQHTKDNLKTSCLICNSVKSGKSYEEAAPLLLKSMQQRRARR